MRQLCSVLVALVVFTVSGIAQQDGPYKVLKTAQGRRRRRLGLHLRRRRWTPAVYPARRDARHRGHRYDAEVPAVAARLTIFDLDTLEPVGEIAGVGGNGTAVDPKSGHGFTSDHPKVSMFDTKTMTLIKTSTWAPHGRMASTSILQPTRLRLQPSDEGRDGHRRQRRHGARHDRSRRRAGAGRGGRQGHALCRDAGCRGSVTAVDVKTMKATAHYPFGDKGGATGSRWM